MKNQLTPISLCAPSYWRPNHVQFPQWWACPHQQPHSGPAGAECDEESPAPGAPGDSGILSSVPISFANGVLNLTQMKGDNSPVTLNIHENFTSPAQVQVTGNVAGGSFLTPIGQAVTSIVVKLNDGNDTVYLNGSPSNASGTGTVVGPTVSISLGKGADLVDIGNDPNLTPDGITSNSVTISATSSKDLANPNAQPTYDTVYVDYSTINTLTITLGDHYEDYVYLDYDTLAKVTVTEGSGYGDLIEASNDTLGTVYFTQGSGYEDAVYVADSTATSLIQITQGDGDYDAVYVYDVYGFDGSTGYHTASLVIKQGDGDYDYVSVHDVDLSSATITQGFGFEDYVEVYNADFYHTIYNPQTDSFKSIYGNLKITQGDGSSDEIYVYDISAQNGYITQGDGGYDLVDVYDSDFVANLTITVGDGNYATVEVGYDGSYGVDVGKETTITVQGHDTNIYLGGPVTYLETGSLSVFAGLFNDNVYVDNVSVDDFEGYITDASAFLEPGSSTLFDSGGNSGFEWDSTWNYIPI